MKTNSNENFLLKLRRSFRPLNIYNKLKSIYFAIIPRGSKVYVFTHNFLSILIKKLNPYNLSYKEWIRQNDNLNQKDRQKFQEKIKVMVIKPQFSIIMPVYNTPKRLLEAAILSVVDQIYPYWELCIADDASSNPDVYEIINKYCHQDQRIKAVFRKENGHISAASNSALDIAKKEFIALLDHDDMLHPLALYMVAQTIAAHPDCEIVYTDEDKITKSGRRLDAYFKPDFNYELLLCQNMVSHLGVYRTERVQQVGGFRVGLEGSQDYDLLLRILEKIDFTQILHIPYPLYHWRISKESVAEDVNIKPYAIESGKRAIQEHLHRRSISAEVKFLPELAGYQINYAQPTENPSVTILIRDVDFSNTLVTCLDSIITSTNYQNFTILLCLPQSVNKSSATQAKKWEQRIRIEYIPDGIQQSYSKLNNEIISSISDEYILLLDRTLMVSNPDWLKSLLGQANQPAIGAVGPKMVFSNGYVYSGGIILLPNGKTRHIFKGEKQNDNGYFGWAKLARGYSALSEKCMLFKRSSFHAVNGFNETLQTSLYSGIDFCLKLKRLGLRNIIFPLVEFYIQDNHHYNMELEFSNQQISDDQTVMREKWEKWMQNDPAFNPNLSFIGEGQITANLTPALKLPGMEVDEIHKK